jgi:ABC-2 type transport system ATP-binding protein
MREDEATILVSSHVLRDVEKVVNRVICLDRGRLVTDAALDELKELYAEWLVVSGDGTLPEHFSEPFVIAQQGNGREARLLVKDGSTELAGFRTVHDVGVTVRPLNLEEIFPVLIGEQL